MQIRHAIIQTGPHHTLGGTPSPSGKHPAVAVARHRHATPRPLTNRREKQFSQILPPLWHSRTLNTPTHPIQTPQSLPGVTRGRPWARLLFLSHAKKTAPRGLILVLRDVGRTLHCTLDAVWCTGYSARSGCGCGSRGSRTQRALRSDSECGGPPPVVRCPLCRPVCACATVAVGRLSPLSPLSPLSLLHCTVLCQCGCASLQGSREGHSGSGKRVESYINGPLG